MATLPMVAAPTVYCPEEASHETHREMGPESFLRCSSWRWSACPFLINVDQFRPTLQADLSTALGREVTLGNLHLKVLTGEVTADDLSIWPKIPRSANLRLFVRNPCTWA
jgi:hypothetical protein